MDPDIIVKINKFYHYCQMYRKSLGQFYFTLQDDVKFNHLIIINIIYIHRKLVLYIVDKATCFNTVYQLKSISAKATQDALQILQINTYLGPLDFIVTDTGKNFVSKEFTQLASSINTIIVNIPVETHQSISAVKCYYAVLRWLYEIISKEVLELAPKIAL